MGMPYTVLMPVIATQVLHGGADTLGVLMAASGLGALCGALYLASRRSVLGLGRHHRRHRRDLRPRPGGVLALARAVAVAAC